VVTNGSGSGLKFLRIILFQHGTTDDGVVGLYPIYCIHIENIKNIENIEIHCSSSFLSDP